MLKSTVVVNAVQLPSFARLRRDLLRQVSPRWLTGDPGCDVLFGQAVVFFQDFAQAVVGKGDDGVVIDASHGFGGDHGVDDGFFGGLDGGQEERIEAVVGQHFQVADSLGGGGFGIGGGEGDEDVSGAVAGVAAVAAQA